MQTVKASDKNVIKKAAHTLKNGGLIIYPTETVYGVGVDATNKKAVRKLIKYKNRPFGKPFSIAVTNESMAQKFVHLNSTGKKLYKNFLPGPLTVISKGKGTVAPGIESESGTLGIRIPDYPLVIKIVKAANVPMTSTSANASYKKRPYQISDVLDNLNRNQKGLIDLIIDAGTLPKRDPSTVVDTTHEDQVVLRQGDVKFSKESKILSKNEENTMNLAKELWQKYSDYHKRRSIVFALQGEMGTGKTIFTKGLAKAMGIYELVTSPTYSIENEYKNSRIDLYHFDTWRLEDNEELKKLDFEKLIKDKKVISIEWAEKVENYIRQFDDEAIVLWLKIEYGENENDRVISWGTI